MRGSRVSNKFREGDMMRGKEALANPENREKSKQIILFQTRSHKWLDGMEYKFNYACVKS